ncbi:MAG: hypothetical protein Q9M11_01085 [Mariprofundaceae bacterium]|nr:hypothetical protein [Mariprofundaceae bacterium]
MNEKEGLNLTSQKMKLSNGASVELDGYDEEENAVCEIYARIGKLKGSQPDKVASDFLKMLLVEKDRGLAMRKIFCFASNEASSHLAGRSWLAHAARDFNIEIKTIQVPKKIEDAIKHAQVRQKMINA